MRPRDRARGLGFAESLRGDGRPARGVGGESGRHLDIVPDDTDTVAIGPQMTERRTGQAPMTMPTNRWRRRGHRPKPGQAGPDSAAKPCSYTSLIAGGGVVPEPLLAELRRLGAGVRPVTNPEDLGAETGYGPSTALRRFIRARDTTCCFVGCDRPAEYCDADHTIPFDTSRLTHPGNLKSLCREHHLLKTFWVGRGGWTDEQLGDGTVVWTSPSGLRHLAPPGSRIHFPDWDTATPVPDFTTPAVQRGPGRELRMPLRKRTRAQRRLDGIRAERERNRRLDAEIPRLPPAAITIADSSRIDNAARMR